MRIFIILKIEAIAGCKEVYDFLNSIFEEYSSYFEGPMKGSENYICAYYRIEKDRLPELFKVVEEKMSKEWRTVMERLFEE